MQGLTMKSLKKNPSLIPLYAILGLGMVGAGWYTLRLATRNPEVSWNRKTNPEPWTEYENKQYKFYSPVRDYSTYKNPAPKFE